MEFNNKARALTLVTTYLTPDENASAASYKDWRQLSERFSNFFGIVSLDMLRIKTTAFHVSFSGYLN